jgi:hypothetical protein
MLGWWHTRAMRRRLRSSLKPTDRQEELLLGAPTLHVFARLLHMGVSDPNRFLDLYYQAGSNLLARESAEPYLKKEKELTATIMAIWKQADVPEGDSWERISWERIFEEARHRKTLYLETHRKLTQEAQEAQEAQLRERYRERERERIQQKEQEALEQTRIQKERALAQGPHDGNEKAREEQVRELVRKKHDSTAKREQNWRKDVREKTVIGEFFEKVQHAQHAQHAHRQKINKLALGAAALSVLAITGGALPPSTFGTPPAYFSGPQPPFVVSAQHDLSSEAQQAIGNFKTISTQDQRTLELLSDAEIITADELSTAAATIAATLTLLEKAINVKEMERAEKEGARE